MRLLTDEQKVMEYLIKAKDLKFASMMIQIADGKVVYLELSEKVKM